MILLAFTLSTPDDVIAKEDSNSSRVKFEVKNVARWFCILYWRIGPNTSSLAQLLSFSAPISSNNNTGDVYIKSNLSL